MKTTKQPKEDSPSSEAGFGVERLVLPLVWEGIPARGLMVYTATVSESLRYLIVGQSGCGWQVHVSKGSANKRISAISSNDLTFDFAKETAKKHFEQNVSV